MTAPNPTDTLPAAFLQRLQTIVPAPHWQSVLASFAELPATGFRINRLRGEIAPVLTQLRDQGLAPQPVSWSDDCFWVPASQRRQLTHSDLVNTGHVYVLDLGSAFIASLVQAQPGEEVLDLAAAPGGKTLCLAATMQNRGRLAAVEVVKNRFHQLKQQVARYGASEVVAAYLKDGRQVGRQVPERFDRVLLDAPCSSESRFKAAEPSSFQFWSEKKIADMQRKQKQLLHAAVLALKPGGRLVYSTCSFAPEENEMVVDRQLRYWGEQLTLEPIDAPFANVQDGLTQWGKKNLDHRLVGAKRILPNQLMRGFFVCVLRKQ